MRSLLRGGLVQRLDWPRNSNWTGELACAKVDAGSESGHENICSHPARARILRVGVRYGPEQECCCPTNIGKNLLCEDHRLWHSATMRKVLRHSSDHVQPANDNRPRTAGRRRSDRNCCARQLVIARYGKTK